MSAFEDVVGVGEVPEGRMIGVRLSDGQPVCVFNHRGVIGAVGDVCTHAHFNLSEGYLHTDGTIECIWHGARFDCRTGAVARPPADRPVRVYDVKVDDGRVLIDATRPVAERSA